MTDASAKLIGMLALKRAEVHELYQSQARLVDALGCAKEVISGDVRIVKDQRFVELLSIFDKALEAVVPPEALVKSALLR